MHVPKRVWMAAGVLVAIPLIVLAALPFFFDENQLRPVVEAQLQQKLHRPVKLGELHLKSFPLAVRISGFVIGQPEGLASSQPFLQAKAVSAGVSFWPLLHKEIKIDAIRLESPRLELIRNAAGVWNYEDGNGGAVGAGAPGSITLDELRVVDGQVAVQDQKAGTAREVYEHIDLTLKGLGPNRGGSLDGEVRLKTMAAVLRIHSDFENRETLTAKGLLSLKSDRNADALNIAYDIRREPAPAPITINSLKATIGRLTATAAGTIDIQQTPAALRLRVQMTNSPIADLLRVAALYGAGFPPGLKAEGLLGADVQVTGTTAKPVLVGKIDATTAQISAKDLAEPVRASALHIDFTPDSLTTRRFTLQTGATSLTAQATVTNYSSSSPRIEAAFETTNARVEELLRIAKAYGVKPAGLAGSGVVSLNMRISKAGKLISSSGSGTLRGVSLSAPQLPKTLGVSTANVNFSDDHASFDNLRATLGSMQVDGTGSVRDFSQPSLQFNLHVDQINSAELRTWSSGSTQQPSGKQQSGFFDKVSANGVLAVDKLIHDRIVFNNVKATITYAKGILTLDPITALVFGGQQSGAMSADLRSATPAYAVRAKLSNVDANQLLSSTTSIKQVLSGSLSSNVDLQFLDRPNEEVAKSLNGKVQFQMGQGRISGVQILNEVANIGHFLGYSKKAESFTNISKLTGSFQIQNGLASTQDLFMDLGGATLSGTGTMGLVDQSLKLRVMTVLGKELAQKNAGGQIGGLLTSVLANQKGELVVPAIVTGTFAQPRFAPDLEQIAQLKVRGLLPTADNPAAFTSGVKGIVESFTKKPPGAKPSEPQPGSLFDILKQLGKKKDEKKQ